MKPTPIDDEPEDDAEFIASLRQLPLRPPPAACRREILAAAKPAPSTRLRWHRSPFWRSMAALWIVLLGLWLDTPRSKSAAGASTGFAPSSPVSAKAFHVLLSRADHSISYHSSPLLP